MKRARAVIGANFGDEGKGLITDFYSTPDTVVVRFNGGAQAAHTVRPPNDEAHVFHHLGSGTLRGADTFLSKFFICNPILWAKERNDLRKEGRWPTETKIMLDRRAMLTTPYDMLINQALEIKRGVDRHGSCGAGINETVVRCSNPEFATYAWMAEKPEILRRQLLAIRDLYLPKRFAELNEGAKIEAPESLLKSDTLIDNFIYDSRQMAIDILICDPMMKLGYQDYVFEGAQGLLLDQTYGTFPFVTRSNTGLRNVVALCDEWGIADIEATYVTRAYMTRHGAGPLDYEEVYEGITFPDPTNQPNDYQGRLRFAPLDVPALGSRIKLDLKLNSKGGAYTGKIRHKLAVTCLDQVVDHPGYIVGDGKLYTSSIAEFLAYARRNCGAEETVVSFGPHRTDIQDEFHLVEAG